MPAIRSLSSPIPGSIEDLRQRAHLANHLHLLQEVRQPNSPPCPASLAAALADCSASKVFSACSISVSMSPMPRIRLAIRSGWNTSKSVSASPLEANMIGCQ